MHRLDDRAEIQDQMFVYARATDWLEPENHLLVFAEECVFASPHSGDIHGAQTIVDWMNTVLPQFEATQHLISNITISFTGEHTADAVSYVRAWHRFLDQSKPDMILWGGVPRQVGAHLRHLADSRAPSSRGRHRAAARWGSAESAQGQGVTAGNA